MFDMWPCRRLGWWLLSPPRPPRAWNMGLHGWTDTGALDQAPGTRRDRRVRGGLARGGGDRPRGLGPGELGVPQGRPSLRPCAAPQGLTSDRREFMSQVWKLSWA